MDTKPCPVCQSPALVQLSTAGRDVRCCRCGEFHLSGVDEDGLPGDKDSLEVARLSGWLRENWGGTITEKDIAGILGLRLPTVGEKADRILLHLAKCQPKPGREIRPSTNGPTLWQKNLEEEHLRRDGVSDLGLLGVAYCADRIELDFLLTDYLLNNQKFIRRTSTDPWPVKITPAGWARIHELQQGTGTGASAFVAMWFGAAVQPAFIAISAGIRDAGYETVRIDKVEHNHKIDDEIIASIRRCKFLVADLTRHRGGVYFEAGFALGLGRPVIWMCREDDLANVHFDNRQYNMILWQPERPDDLRQRLANRIEATLGRGPVNGNGGAGKPAAVGTTG